MKKVIIDYGRVSGADLMKQSSAIIEGLTGNVHFPVLPVKVDDMKTQRDIFVAALTIAANHGREELAHLRAEKTVLANMLKKNASYVNTIASGNEVLLLTSGFIVTKTMEKNRLPGAVARIHAHFTNLPQSIELIWSRSKHTRYYEVHISADGGETWTLASTVFGRKLMVETLVTGKKYQFKVIPVGISGVGSASSIASQIAA